MDDILQQLKARATNSDTTTRLNLLSFVKELQQLLETPADTLQRIAYSPLQACMARLGIDLHIFEILSKTNEPLTGQKLSQENNADPVLLSRITRCLASFGMISETGPGTYTANKVTQSLAREDFQDAFNHVHLLINPVFMQLAPWLSEHQYTDPTDPLHLPFQQVWNTRQAFYPWVQTMPWALQNAAMYMGTWRDGVQTWLDVYPLEAEIKTLHLTDSDTLLVDVGGGFGGQCRALRARFPHLPGRVVLQDQPETLAMTPPIDGVEFMAQDFFQPQQFLKDVPAIFYLRNVLHDYPESKCVTILSHLRDHLKTCPDRRPPGKILIDEITVPDIGASNYTTNLDMVMLVMCGSRERTRDHWDHLVESVGGLRINRRFIYDSVIGMTVMEVVVD